MYTESSPFLTLTTQHIHVGQSFPKKESFLVLLDEKANTVTSPSNMEIS